MRAAATTRYWMVAMAGFGCGLLAAALLGGHAAETASPPGSDASAKTRALALGAKAMQGNAPVGAMDIHLVGFHPLKAEPGHQMEAHHFCRQVNEDFAQCVLFDGDGVDANLNGIEYIVSEKLFASLPETERSYWHPHNAEILSGQLIAPGIPDVAEKALMKGKMNSYGKTWHVWNTGAFDREPDRLPLGEAMLAWSFNRDGEAKPELVEARDRRLGVSTGRTRERRAELRELARPQYGVDALKGAFERPVRDIPGVVDAAD